MEVTLHIGAHHTASASLQHFAVTRKDILEQRGIGFVGPNQTGSGRLFAGVIPSRGHPPPAHQFRKARGRIGIQMGILGGTGCRTMLVSDNNILGSPRQNLRERTLYPDAARRLQLFCGAFGDRVGKVVLTVRSYEDFWVSSLAYAIWRGYRVPDAGEIANLVEQPRRWRDLVEETAKAFEGAKIEVQCHETYAGLPAQRLWHMTDGQCGEFPSGNGRTWLNRSPRLPALRGALMERGVDPSFLTAGEGRWRPFDRAQSAAMREDYADDLFWLRAGADGIATLTEEARPASSGSNRAVGQVTRGHEYDGQFGQNPSMAGSG